MKVKDTARILLNEITREWEFEHNGKEHTFRVYEGLHGMQMWLDGEEVDYCNDEVVLDDMTGEEIRETCMDFEYTNYNITYLI
jgi:hypothetical protein